MKGDRGNKFYLDRGKLDLSILDEEIEQEESYIVIPDEISPVLEEIYEDMILDIDSQYSGETLSATLEEMAAIFEKDEYVHGNCHKKDYPLEDKSEEIYELESSNELESNNEVGCTQDYCDEEHDVPYISTEKVKEIINIFDLETLKEELEEFDMSDDIVIDETPVFKQQQFQYLRGKKLTADITTDNGEVLAKKDDIITTSVLNEATNKGYLMSIVLNHE